MLRLLIDQNLDHRILRGLKRRIPMLDSVTAMEIGMSKGTDTKLLAWAAQASRVIVTNDRTTMPVHAAELMSSGESLAGIVVVLRRLPLRQVIEDLEMIVVCSENDEWVNVIRYLPL